MKILNITAQKPNSTGSGVFMTELVNSWSALGCEQAVVAGIYEEDEVCLPEGVRLYPVVYKSEELPFAIAGMSDEMPYESTKYADISGEMLEQFRQAFRRQVEGAVRELEPDMICCHHLYLLTAMVREWCPDRKVVGICHGSDLRQFGKNAMMREYIRGQIPKLDAIFALHEEQRREIARIFSCDIGKIHASGAGYNQNVFYRGEKKPREFWQLVFAGKVSEKKGVFSLIRSLDYLNIPPERLVLKIAGTCGAEAEYREITELAAKSRYRIEFEGMLPQTKLAELFRQSDVFVLPSFFEGLALVNLEAMACGCKVVCSDIPGMSDWFREHFSGEAISFVELPPMRNVDEPEPEGLPAFEERLARAVEEKLEGSQKEIPDLEAFSWKGLSRKIVECVCENDDL